MTDAPASAIETAPDGLPTPRRYWAIASIFLAIMMSVVDSSIVNIALPTIATNLQIDAASSIWIVNAYQIVLVMALLPLASLGELVSYRRVSQVGLVVFTIGSLACCLASSFEQLVAFRAFQGLGAAGIMSVNGALVRFTYPHRLLGRGIGYNAVVVAISAAIGPTLGAALLSIGDWRLLFAVNVPVGVIATIIALFSLPHSALTRRPPNPVGAIMCAATLGLVITGLQILAHGEQAWIGAGITIAGLLTGFALYRHERHRQHPLVPFDLLTKRVFGLSVITSIASFMAQMLALVSLPFALHAMGYDAVMIGLLLTPWPIAVGIAAPIAGRMADRYPAGLLGGIGLAIFAAGLAALAFLPAHASVADIVWRTALCGLGFGMFQSPNNRAMLSSAPRERSGVAGGMLGTSRVLGQSLGAAVAAFVLATQGAHGAAWALGTAAAVALAAAIVSIQRLGREPPETPRISPARIDQGARDFDA